MRIRVTWGIVAWTCTCCWFVSTSASALSSVPPSLARIKSCLPLDSTRRELPPAAKQGLAAYLNVLRPTLRSTALKVIVTHNLAAWPGEPPFERTGSLVGVAEERDEQPDLTDADKQWISSLLGNDILQANRIVLTRIRTESLPRCGVAIEAIVPNDASQSICAPVSAGCTFECDSDGCPKP